MEIADFIPFGHDNGVTARELSQITGITERKIRDRIALERHNVVILNLQDGQGYFRPTEDEKSLVWEWVRQEENRLRSIGYGLKAARKVVRG
jgi:hypothetical protein